MPAATRDPISSDASVPATAPHDLLALNGAPALPAADRVEAPLEPPAAPAEGDAGNAGSPAPPAALTLVTETVFLPPAAPRDEPEDGRQPAPRAAKPKPSKTRPKPPAPGPQRGPKRPADSPTDAPRRAQARRARRAPDAGSTDDLGPDAVDPAQAQSRTGVCRSYFINPECWRVPGAYCNTALQICVIRNCPVYHLHKDALERRFAKKFKHFW